MLNLLWNIISISNIWLTITHREMEWLNLPIRTYSKSLRKPLLRIKGIGIPHWILHSGLIEWLLEFHWGHLHTFLSMARKQFYDQIFIYRLSNLLNLLVVNLPISSKLESILFWKLKEERNQAKEKFHIHQQRIKRWFDKHVVGDKQFQVRDLVLKWDKESKAKSKHSKFQKIWLGPYEIAEKIGDATYKLQSLQGDLENLPINASILKKYFC